MVQRLVLSWVLAWVMSIVAFANSHPLHAPVSHPSLTDENQRYLCIALLNTTEGAEFGLDVIREGAKKGCNAVMVTVRWDVVYYTPSSSANWAQYDNQIRLAKELGLKVFLRIHLARCCNRNEGYWEESESARDERGNTLKEIFSMSHEPSLQKALGFVREVCQRYNSDQQNGHILCLAATTTTTQESGYHYENSANGGNYTAMYDYSPSMITGYREWLLQRYGSLSKINSEWKSDYNNVNDIQPVNTSYPHSENKRWSDWYVFRHNALKKFLDGVSSSAKGVNGSYKVINDFGSVHDGLSFRRATFAFKDLARNTDGTKINDSQYFSHYFSADVLRSNMGTGKWIMNEAFREPGLSQYGMQLMLSEHFERGCKLVNIVANNTDDINWYSPGITWVLNNWLNKPMTPIVPVQSMIVKLSELVRTGGYPQAGYSSRWDEKKKYGPVEVRLVEDLLGEPEVNQPPIVNSPLPNYSFTAGFEASYKIPDDAFKDPDGSIEYYEVGGLPAGLYFENNTIKGSASSLGKYTITVKATDLYDASTSTTFTLTINAPITSKINLYKAGNFQTRVLLKELKNGDTLNLKEHTYPLNFFAEAASNVEAVVMKLAGPVSRNQTETDKPFGLYGDNDGINLKVGSYELTVEAYNSQNISSLTALGKTSLKFVVIDKELNIAPRIVNPVAEPQAAIGRAFDWNFPSNVFQDVDGSIVKLVFTNLPAGLKAVDWKISGTPTQIGTFRVTVEAIDNLGASAKTTFNIKVAAFNQAPTVVSTIPDQSILIQQPYEYTIPLTLFKDEDGYIVRIIAVNTPPGISLQNGKLKGVPTSSGIYQIGIRAIDNEGAWGEFSFRLTVKGAESNQPPIVVSTIPDQKTVVGRTFTYTIPAAAFKDPDGGAIRFEAQNLPIGLTLKDGIISGVPSTAGEFRTTIRAIDNLGASVQTSFTIGVTLTNGNIPPTIVTALADQNAVVGQEFHFFIPLTSFRDPDGALSSIVVRNLPQGLVYQGGEITGVPELTGNYTVLVKVFDNQGASVDAYVVIKITNPVGSVAFNFGLYKAGGSMSRRLIRLIQDNDKISITELPSFINIFAEGNTVIDRIVFEMKGPINVNFTDATSPFAVFDDNGGFGTALGVYNLKVRAIKNNQTIGEKAITFEITKGSGGGGGDFTNAESELWAPYPNPFNESITLNIPSEYEPSDTHFSLISLIGERRPVPDVLWLGQKAVLNVSSLRLPQGIYFLQVNNNNFDFVHKTLKLVKVQGF